LTTEWDVYPIDTFTDFGIHNYQGILPLNPPQNVTAVVSGNDIILSWDAVPTAGSYNIYMSSTPDGIFGSIGTTLNTNITLPGYAANYNRAFFLVKASR
jgi:hypothetical protein